MWPLLNGGYWDLTVVVGGRRTEQGEDMQGVLEPHISGILEGHGHTVAPRPGFR